jgi:anti-sigma B factor antagonist
MQINARDVGEATIFDIQGKIVLSALPGISLHQAVKIQLERGRRQILLNLEGADAIDSCGVGEILSSFVSVQNLGGKIALTQVSRRLATIFKITGLNRVFEVFENEAAALQSFSKT